MRSSVPHLNGKGIDSTSPCQAVRWARYVDDDGVWPPDVAVGFADAFGEIRWFGEICGVDAAWHAEVSPCFFHSESEDGR